jgi:hypothetical protein
MMPQMGVRQLQEASMRTTAAVLLVAAIGGVCFVDETTLFTDR